MRVKALILTAVIAFVLTLSGCGAKAESQNQAVQPSASAAHQGQETQPVDLDLTQLSETMVYSQIYNMMEEPGEYLGQRVRMKGKYLYYLAEEQGLEYHVCTVTDATACCLLGMEFVLEEGSYPQPDEEFTVEGIFQIYYEGDIPFCQLEEAVIL